MVISYIQRNIFKFHACIDGLLVTKKKAPLHTFLLLTINWISHGADGKGREGRNGKAGAPPSRVGPVWVTNGVGWILITGSANLELSTLNNII